MRSSSATPLREAASNAGNTKVGEGISGWNHRTDCEDARSHQGGASIYPADYRKRQAAGVRPPVWRYESANVASERTVSI